MADDLDNTSEKTVIIRKKKESMDNENENKIDGKTDSKDNSQDKSGLFSSKIEQRIITLKQGKSKAKSSFTRSRHQLLYIMEEDLPSRREVRKALEKMISAQEIALAVMSNLSDEYATKGDSDLIQKVCAEMETLDEECTRARYQAEEYLDARRNDASSVSSKASSKIGLFQLEQVKARQQADRIRAEVKQKEHEFNMERKHMENEFKRHLKQMDEMMTKERGRLQHAEEELYKCQGALEMEMEAELGLLTVKPRSATSWI